MGGVFGKKKKKSKYASPAPKKKGGPPSSKKGSAKKSPHRDEISKFDLSSSDEERNDKPVRSTPSNPPLPGRKRPPPVRVTNLDDAVHIDSPAAALHKENMADAVMANHVAGGRDTPSGFQAGTFVVKAKSGLETLATSQEVENDFYWGDLRQGTGNDATLGPSPLGPDPNSLRLDLAGTIGLSPTSANNHQDVDKTFDEEEDERVEWQRGELLGQGSFGKVYLGLELGTGQMLAVKQVEYDPRDKQLSEDVTSLILEIRILQRLQHENIVRYLGIQRERDKGLLNIFLEYVPGGSIAQLLSKFGKFQESVLRVYTRQILEGLHYLHVNRIIHRDIKGANILVDDKGTIKLADFGASKKLAGLVTMNSGLQSMRGSPYWMAPEVIKQTGYGRQADIWSLGCTVVEMATGSPPWSKYTTQVSALYHIASTDETPELPPSLSPEGTHFLTQCFNRNPAKRPTAATLLRHPFVANATRKAGAFSERRRNGSQSAGGSLSQAEPFERGTPAAYKSHVQSPTAAQTPPRTPSVNDSHYVTPSPRSASPFVRDHPAAAGATPLVQPEELQHTNSTPGLGYTPHPAVQSAHSSSDYTHAFAGLRAGRRGSSADSAAIAAYLTVKVEKEKNSRNISAMIRESVSSVDRDRRTRTLGLLTPTITKDGRKNLEQELANKREMRRQDSKSNGLGAAKSSGIRASRSEHALDEYMNHDEGGSGLAYGETLGQRRRQGQMSVNVNNPTGATPPNGNYRSGLYNNGTPGSPSLLTPDSIRPRPGRRRSDVGIGYGTTQPSPVSTDSPSNGYLPSPPLSTPKTSTVGPRSIASNRSSNTLDHSPGRYVPSTPDDHRRVR
eukprot:TRINITY_DN1361_c1_g1_i1.p1 TRINITY_DN1361_c1_g1~~TRINITY_DN1361_c1_g1_i1.p1  ORF type:complete len:844 (-),score=166.08 TRINITY_DN1361_c1_g1_i1:35-2566(-)